MNTTEKIVVHGRERWQSDHSFWLGKPQDGFSAACEHEWAERLKYAPKSLGEPTARTLGASRPQKDETEL